MRNLTLPANSAPDSSNMGMILHDPSAAKVLELKLEELCVRGLNLREVTYYPRVPPIDFVPLTASSFGILS